jgi:hypothetical protein
MKYLDTTIKFGALVLGTIGLATIFGMNLARLIAVESRPLDKTLIGRKTNGLLIFSRGTRLKQRIYKKNLIHL